MSERTAVNITRRDALRLGAIGLATLLAASNIGVAYASVPPSGEKPLQAPDAKKSPGARLTLGQALQAMIGRSSSGIRQVANPGGEAAESPGAADADKPKAFGEAITIDNDLEASQPQPPPPAAPQAAPSIALDWEPPKRWSNIPSIGNTRVDVLSKYELPEFAQRGYYDGSKYILEKGAGQFSAVRKAPPIFEGDFKLRTRFRLTTPSLPNVYLGLVFGSMPDDPSELRGQYIVHPTNGYQNHGDMALVYISKEINNGKWNQGFFSWLEKAGVPGFVYRGSDTTHELALLCRGGRYYSYYNGGLVEYNYENGERHNVIGLELGPVNKGRAGIMMATGNGESIPMRGVFDLFEAEGDSFSSNPNNLSL